MGHPSRTSPSRLRVFRALLFFLTVLRAACCAQTTTSATTIPLLLPSALVYDAQGNLYFAEIANHTVLRISAGGTLSTIAGTGTQGYSGDNGPATAALLDAPAALALDTAGNLFLADTASHAIRRIDAGTGIITTVTTALDRPTAIAVASNGDLYLADGRRNIVQRLTPATGSLITVAGTGTQGFAGDGGPAPVALLDTPLGLALDSSGNLYIADAHNHRVRRVDAVTGIITTVSGNGQPGILSLPHGLALDATGHLFLVDSAQHRVRQVDLSTGAVTPIAGQGTEGYSGDNGPATTATLDSPQSIALSPAGLPTLTDTHNQAIRQVDSAGIIHTLAGLAASPASTLTLSAPTVVAYGTGTLTATLLASAATGSINLLQVTSSTPLTLATQPLSANTAAFSTANLPAGAYRLFATYTGDATHPAAQSPTLSLSVAPASAIATPASTSMLYGQAVPVLTGTLTGILPRDANLATLALSTTATSTSAPAAYPITATLAGSAAANYQLTTQSAAITVTQAPSTVTLSASLAAHASSTTTGIPTGTVTLLDNGTLAATSTLSATGDATFSTSSLAAGTHTLTATYTGDTDFLASTSSPITISTSAAAPDFTLTSTGATAQTIIAGNAATFSFDANPTAALPGPIILSVSGLPPGATASFSPASLPPSSSTTPFTLTIRTVRTTASALQPLLPIAALLFLPTLFTRRRRRTAFVAFCCLLAVGCGDRVATPITSQSGRSYTITVTGTSTTSTGAVLLHTATVTLTLL